MKRRKSNATPALVRGVRIAVWLVCATSCVVCTTSCAREDRDAAEQRAETERAESELARGELVAFAPRSATSDVELARDLPDGWRLRVPGPRQAVAFYVHGDPRVRCHLTLLAGDDGGLASTVDRWRREWGLAQARPEELERLSVVRFLEREARVVDLEARSEDGAQRTALVGIVASDDNGSAIFELSGPSELVHAERGPFLELARSLAVRSAAPGRSAPP
ncbi:MAG: hypothetical protein HZA52_20405 [Planctomycetes bacterium]|nr:hypothetical protein [Planctomycetota bacterium]